MSTCGNCGKSVTARDVTCPHCGVLLAAYASPEGSGAAGTYEAPAPPPSAEIPAVEMDVKPPSEKDVITDPTKVTEEPISTAPRPLFDTYLTVEEIAKAAESDHANDVVTISDKEITTKTVEFEVPDYAKPPASADPIPIVDDEDFDPSIPLITRDDVPPDDEPAPEEGAPPPKAQPANESWLYPKPQRESRAQPESVTSPATEQKPRPNVAKPEPAPTPAPKPTTRSKSTTQSSSEPVGATDEYLRKLHAEAGYTPESGAISKPVENRRISPAERRNNRRKMMSAAQNGDAGAKAKSTQTGCLTLYVLVLAIFWFSTVISVVGGNFSPFLIFMTVAATIGYSHVRKFVNELS